MFTLCHIHAPFSLRERRRRFGYTLPYLVNPLSLLQALYTYRSGCGASKLVAMLANYRVPRVEKLPFAKYVSGWSGYESSHISAIIASIRSKFATEVPKALYFHNPALTQIYFRRLMVSDGHKYRDLPSNCV